MQNLNFQSMIRIASGYLRFSWFVDHSNPRTIIYKFKQIWRPIGRLHGRTDEIDHKFTKMKIWTKSRFFWEYSCCCWLVSNDDKRNSKTALGTRLLFLFLFRNKVLHSMSQSNAVNRNSRQYATGLIWRKKVERFYLSHFIFFSWNLEVFTSFSWAPGNLRYFHLRSL